MRKTDYLFFFGRFVFSLHPRLILCFYGCTNEFKSCVPMAAGRTAVVPFSLDLTVLADARVLGLLSLVLILIRTLSGIGAT